MTIRLASLVSLAAAVAALSTPRPVAAQASDEIAEGSKVYSVTCGRCHNARSPIERTDREWVTIANHMRVRANLTRAQIQSVLAFLQATNSDPREMRSLPRPPAVVAPAPEVAGPAGTDSTLIAAGRALVLAKACIGCHVIGNAGGNVGPALNDVVARRGPAFVRQKLADPTADNASSMMPNLGLATDEIEAITAYLASLRR